MKAWQHFKTITHHRWLVRKGCFAVGLFWQGLTHDLSKYTPTEFMVGAKYYQGTRSPNAAEREKKGFSEAWIHHKGRNRHHYEYWIDLTLDPSQGLQGMPMPTRYVVEMFCDRIAASKNYNKGTYNDSFPLQYYEKNKMHYILHKDTKDLLERLLHMLADEGEDAVFSYIRKHIDLKHSPKW